MLLKVMWGVAVFILICVYVYAVVVTRSPTHNIRFCFYIFIINLRAFPLRAHILIYMYITVVCIKN